MTKAKFLIVLKSLSWVGMIFLFIVISIAAIEKSNKLSAAGLKVRFTDDENLGFLNSKDVLKEINLADPSWKGKNIAKIKFNLIENGLKQNEYVKRAEVYLDNQSDLNVQLIPKKPIARIHSEYGSYYLSEDWDRMSLSSKFSKRIVHVAGRVEALTNPKNKMDSFIRHSVMKLLDYCEENKIWQDAIDQIYINADGKIDLILVFSEPIVKLGHLNEDLDRRMNKVDNFFKAVVRCHDISKYQELDFQYSHQVVARLK